MPHLATKEKNEVLYKKAQFQLKRSKIKLLQTFDLTRQIHRLKDEMIVNFFSQIKNFHRYL